MFKIFGGKSSSKGKKEKENSQPSDKNLPPDMTPEERKEAEKLPFGGNTRLSKSRSGRYKVKNKQRTALDNDMYATAGSVSASASSAQGGGGAAGSSRSTGASGGSYINNSNSQSGSSSYGGQQGSLGRSSGGHCGVANSVTKRYPGATATTGISSQPTAV